MEQKNFLSDMVEAYEEYIDEETGLDPSDWEDFRTQAVRAVNDVVDYLSSVRTRPVWQPMPEESKQFLRQSLPESGKDLSHVLSDFKTHIFPYTKGNIHPRFWAWVQGTGIPTAVIADMLASAMNPNVTIGEHSAMYVDRQVINWCKEMVGFPVQSGGMLVSGASMANLTALITARNIKFPEVISKGLNAVGTPVVYASAQVHSCIDKAVQVTGLGLDNLCKIPVDEHYKMDTHELEMAILRDRAEGKRPFCVIATLGTVNTGAMDDIAEILDLAKKYNLWAHIDGAFGALAVLTPGYHHLKNLIAQFDSIAFDLHKWMYMPYEAGCVLVRDESMLRSAFAMTPEYLLQHEEGLAAGPESLNNFGIELSRSFKALKIWMTLQEFGLQRFAIVIQQNLAQADYLGRLIVRTDRLELLAPISLNIVCFRYVLPGADEHTLNQLNKSLCMRLQTDGIASPSSTILQGKYAIRVAITNHRSRKSDFDMLVASCVRIGSELSAGKFNQ